MSNMLYFQEDLTVSGKIKFTLTKSSILKLYEVYQDLESIFVQLSKSKILLMTKSRGKDSYELHSNCGTFFCVVTEGTFLVVGYRENALIKQNIAIKHGLNFKLENSPVFQVTVTEPYDIMNGFYDGEIYSSNAFQHLDTTGSIQRMTEVLDKEEWENPMEEEIEVYKPERKLSRLLQLAEDYAEIENEMALEKINETGMRSYYKINALEQDRLDRVAYEFLMDEIEGEIFKAGVQIQVEKINGERETGEIIFSEIDEEREESSIKVLFNQVFDINELEERGWITLSFSSVIKDVQIEAIEKIREGKAPAKYMDNILGKNESSGFENKNLASIEEDFKGMTYPPNESQREAIFSGINAKDAFLVMGPPGTGKTTVILEWAKHFVRNEKKRVLISSQNNKAVDNVIARMGEEEDIDIIRIGSELKLQSEVVPYLFENKLSSLSKTISQKTKENLKSLQDIIESWKDTTERVSTLYQSALSIQKVEGNLEESIRGEILPLHIQLGDIKSSFEALKGKMDKLYDRISKLMEKDESISYPNNYIKALLFVSHNLRRIYIKNRIKKYSFLTYKANYLQEEYHRTYEEYQNIKERIFQDFIPPYFEAVSKREEILSQFQSVEEAGENKWGLFKEMKVKKEELEEFENLQKKYREITEEFNKTLHLRDTIQQWQEENINKKNYALNEIILDSVDLVGATCIGVSSQKRFSNLDFDVTIMDEAGQIQIHNAIVPMSVSNKVIMLGDHKQIPPNVDPEMVALCEENGIKTELLEKSLFEKMYETLPVENKRMLDTQYRMPGEIADTISEWFYEGQYQSPDFKRNLPSPFQELSPKPFVIIDTSQEKNRHERMIKGAGCDNLLEANIVHSLIKRMIKEKKISLEEIGIISAYKSQVKLIKKILEDSLHPDRVKEMVATLDSYQGQERDIIIYSFAKSSKLHSNKKRIGFLNELRRLNVGMSRCKKTLILIGDMDFLSTCEYQEQDEEESPIYEKSEKQFSDFIKKVIKDVQEGRGELLSSQEAMIRLKKVGE